MKEDVKISNNKMHTARGKLKEMVFSDFEEDVSPSKETTTKTPSTANQPESPAETALIR